MSSHLPLALVPLTPAAQAAQAAAGAPITLLATPRVQLGRSAHDVGASLVFHRDALTVSAVHCVFELRADGGFTVTDRSSNGTWVNDDRVPRAEAEPRGVPVKEGDIVALAAPPGRPVSTPIEFAVRRATEAEVAAVAAADAPRARAPS